MTDYPAEIAGGRRLEGAVRDALGTDEPATRREEDDLARRCRRGDPRALAALYRRLAPPLLEYLERALGDRAEAEDVLHDTFLRLFEGRGRYRTRGRLREWLFTVASRIARDRMRRRRSRDRLAGMAREALEPAPVPDPAEEAFSRAIAARVDSALTDLSADYAMAFHLRVREGYSYRDMAEILDEPEGTLRSRVHHALKRIRITLNALEAGPPASRTRKEEPR